MGGDEVSRVYSDKKVAYVERLEGYLANLPRVLLINADNVGSQQMHIVRAELRKDGQKAEILMGKNTMMKFVIRRAAVTKPVLNKLADAISLNIGLVFTDGDMKKVREVLEKNKVTSGAKAGAIAPVDVFLEPGPTGMEPAQTGFFQALGVATKITKGTIEVIKVVQLAVAGQKVGTTQATLMTKMSMKPFQYGLQVTACWDGEAMIDTAVLDIEDNDILRLFKEAMAKVAAVGLKIGYPVAPAVPHMIYTAFRNCVCLALEADIDFKEAADIKDRIANPDKYGGGGGGGGSAAPAAQAAPAKAAPPPEEEEAEMDFDLFG